MRVVIRILLVAIVVIVGVVGAALLGALVGDATCTDDEYEWFRCMGEVMGGLAVGGLVGAIASVPLGMYVWRRTRGTGSVRASRAARQP